MAWFHWDSGIQCRIRIPRRQGGCGTCMPTLVVFGGEPGVELGLGPGRWSPGSAELYEHTAVPLEWPPRKSQGIEMQVLTGGSWLMPTEVVRPKWYEQTPTVPQLQNRCSCPRNSEAWALESIDLGWNFSFITERVTLNLLLNFLDSYQEIGANDIYFRGLLWELKAKKKKKYIQCLVPSKCSKHLVTMMLKCMGAEIRLTWVGVLTLSSTSWWPS